MSWTLTLLVLLIAIADAKPKARKQNTAADSLPQLSKCKQGLSFHELKKLGKEYMQKQKFFEAIECFSRSSRLHKGDAESLRQLGFASLQVERYEDGEAALKKAIEADRLDWESMIMLGQIYEQRLEYVAAEKQYRTALQLQPKDAQLHAQVGFVASKQGRIDEAVAEYRAALDLNPKLPQVRTNLANQLRKSGKLDEAIIEFQKAVSMFPKSAFDARVGLGKTRYDLGDTEGALRDFVDVMVPLRRVAQEGKMDRKDARAACEASIGVAKIHYERGKQVGNFKIAAEALEVVAPLCNLNSGGDPSLQLQALVLGGLISFHDRKYNESVILLEKARITSRSVTDNGGAVALSGLAALGRVRAELGDCVAAARAYREALERGYSDDRQTFVNAYAEQISKMKAELRWANFNEHFEFLSALAKSQCESKELGVYSSISTYQSLLYPLSDTLTRCIASSFARLAIHNATAARPDSAISPPDPDLSSPKKSLRVGYITSDFNAHTMCERFAAVLNRHNRNFFHIIALSTSGEVVSECRERVRRNVDAFLELNHLSDLDAAVEIKKLKLDVLIDLNGHTKGARLALLAHRLAPVQMTFFGWMGPMGSEILSESVVSDKITTPPDLIPLFDTGKATLMSPQLFSPDYLATRDGKTVWSELEQDAWDWGSEKFENSSAKIDALRRAAATGNILSCFNRIVKMDSESLSSFYRVLNATSKTGSILWLTRHPSDSILVEKHIDSYSGVAGVSPTRMIITPHLPEALHLRVKRNVALHLDTFTYNAHTTATDSLWAGVPTLTIPGSRMSDRVGASIAIGHGLGDFVARDSDEFVRLAKAYLANPQKKRKTKAELEERARREEGVFDTSRWMAQWEKTLKIRHDLAVISRSKFYHVVTRQQ